MRYLRLSATRRRNELNSKQQTSPRKADSMSSEAHLFVLQALTLVFVATAAGASVEKGGSGSQQVAPGGRCSVKGTKCTTGFKCIARGGTRRCRKRVGLGAACRGRTTLCSGLLRCSNAVRGGVCSYVVSNGASCSARLTGCARGSACVHGVCKTALTPGRSCDGFGNYCADELLCSERGPGRHRICKKVIAEGALCEVRFSICEKRFECVGEMWFKTCKPVDATKAGNVDTSNARDTFDEDTADQTKIDAAFAAFENFNSSAAESEGDHF